MPSVQSSPVISANFSIDAYEKISKAAEIIGASLNKFIVASALEKAAQIFEQVKPNLEKLMETGNFNITLEQIDEECRKMRDGNPDNALRKTIKTGSRFKKFLQDPIKIKQFQTFSREQLHER